MNNEINDAVKSIVMQRLTTILREDLQQMMNKLVEETLKGVKHNLAIKMVAGEDNQFRLEFIWRENLGETFRSET